MLANSLTSNEVKDSTGAEIEFVRIGGVGRSVVFAKSGESPALQHRLLINHSEVGTGFKLRRRSNVRVDVSQLSDIDNVTPVKASCYVVLDTPVGALNTYDLAKLALANLISFLASDGTNTTIKYDGTGTGAKCLLEGSI